MTLLPFFEWCEATWLGNSIRMSLWLFPAIEAVHLLGLGLRRYPIPQIARDAAPWLAASVVIMLTTGIALFLSESVKCYYNQAFWVKITTLPIALAFTYGVRQRVARTAAGEATVTTRAVAAVSMVLWFTVAAAGRWIGFS